MLMYLAVSKIAASRTEIKATLNGIVELECGTSGSSQPHIRFLNEAHNLDILRASSYHLKELTKISTAKFGDARTKIKSNNRKVQKLIKSGWIPDRNRNLFVRFDNIEWSDMGGCTSLAKSVFSNDVIRTSLHPVDKRQTKKITDVKSENVSIAKAVRLDFKIPSTMPPIKCKKVTFDINGEKAAGPNVKEIAKINQEIDQLEQKKVHLEEKMQQLLRDMSAMCPKICQAERDVEKALHDKLAKECQLRMKCEITRLCEDQKRTERILNKYDEQLRQKYRAYKRCTGNKCDDV
ncbi:hypothetical protein Trydic_g6821 [Trypoxylus dichotomus]